MSDIADFLRVRYVEARDRENGKRHLIPSVFDGHDVEWIREVDREEILYVDGRPYPVDEYLKIATEPAPDPAVIADLDAKLRILDEVVPEIDAMEDRIDGEWGAGDPAERESMTLLRILAQPFAGHGDHKGGEWAP